MHSEIGMSQKERSSDVMDQRMLSEPVTEQSNEFSKNIDVATPYEIVSILHKCDLEIFEGWHGYAGLMSADILSKMVQVSRHMETVLKDPSSGVVVMSGCGTSGRLAYLTVRGFNKYLKSQGKEECFRYLIAGQDLALFTSQELAEDDPHRGAKCLEEAVKRKTRVVYIGISCGLSAVYVAGQLDLCLSDMTRYTPVVMGFNPSYLARELPIQKWNKTFLTVMKDLQEAEKSSLGFILNPIIGPDPITGSSRMKSGSATRIILECLAVMAIHGYDHTRIGQLIKCYQETCESVYKDKEALGKLIQMGGDSLCSNGHIYYLGSDGFGIMAMIDASECPPTFSASLDDVRGFVSGGYDALANNDGDLSHSGHHYEISLKDFETTVMPSVQEDDLLVIINHDVYKEVQHLAKSASCKKVFITFDSQSIPPEFHKIFSLVLNISLDAPSLDKLTESSAKDLMSQLLQEVALKWVLNNLSTGAHILKGKVYENRMIDVKVSNTKLFFRAIGIVQKLAKCSESDARDSLLKSIYGQDEISVEVKEKPVVNHIMIGAECDQVVPTAILIASLKCTVQEARVMVKNEPVIRKLLIKPSQ